MTPAENIRRRFNESCALMESAERMYQLAKDDHRTRIAEIQDICTHPTRTEGVWQYGIECTCPDCGKRLDYYE